MAVIYAVSIATFGGTTQYVVTWLIKVTGNSLAPAWYWIGAEVVGIIAMSFVRESAPRKLPGFKPEAIGTNVARGSS
jgi:MHS family proline/betaine transporter-like MFS transporter